MISLLSLDTDIICLTTAVKELWNEIMCYVFAS